MDILVFVKQVPGTNKVEIDEETGFIVWVPFEAVTPDNVADYDGR